MSAIAGYVSVAQTICDNSLGEKYPTLAAIYHDMSCRRADDMFAGET